MTANFNIDNEKSEADSSIGEKETHEQCSAKKQENETATQLSSAIIQGKISEDELESEDDNICQSKSKKWFWSITEIQYLLNNSSKSDEEISKILGRSKHAVSLKRQKLGVKRKRRWTRKEIQVIKDNSSLLDKKIAHMLNRSINAIRHRRKQIGIKKESQPKYSINLNFFKQWGKNMAYILGYIYADGNIMARSSRKELIIKSKDLEILVDINKAMESNYKIKNYKDENRSIYSLGIFRKEIVHDLIKLGLTPRKSLKMTFPKIPAVFVSHFIRGYFDGDGHVSISKDNYLAITFTSGSKKFLEGLDEVLKENSIHATSLNSPRNYSFHILSIRKDSRKEFASFLYTDSGLLMKRKKIVFEKYFRKFANKKITCFDCGEVIHRKGGNHKRCNECKKRKKY